MAASRHETEQSIICMATRSANKSMKTNRRYPDSLDGNQDLKPGMHVPPLLSAAVAYFDR